MKRGADPNPSLPFANQPNPPNPIQVQRLGVEIQVMARKSVGVGRDRHCHRHRRGEGAAIGGLMGTLTADMSSVFPAPPPDAPGITPDALTSLNQAQAFTGSPLVQACNFAVMTGVNAGLSCVMKRMRGVEDVESSMVAAFGSGAMFSLVSSMGGPNQAMNAVTSGLFFALVQGGLFKMGQKFSQPPADDICYSRARSLLTRLGLQSYEKKFRKGLLTDSTVPLLTDSAPREVKIPPGPRLLILDHIQRDPELMKARKSALALHSRVN